MVRMESMDGPHPAQKSPNGAPRRDPWKTHEWPGSHLPGIWNLVPQCPTICLVPGGTRRPSPDRSVDWLWASGTIAYGQARLCSGSTREHFSRTRDGASVSQCQLIISHLSRGLAGRAMETWRHGMGKLCRRQPPSSSSSSSSYRIMTD